MTIKRAELLRDLMYICREAAIAEDTKSDTYLDARVANTDNHYLDTCAMKALFNYTSMRNLKELKAYILYYIETSKENK